MVVANELLVEVNFVVVVFNVDVIFNVDVVEVVIDVIDLDAAGTIVVEAEAAVVVDGVVITKVVWLL